MNRTALKVAAAKFLYHTGIERMLRPRHVPVVLAYHRVVEDFASAAATSQPSMLVSLAMLEQHLDWIGRRYRFVDLDDLATAESPAAAVTFDDGYRDFYELAMPLLLRKGIPAALFAVTDYVGTDRVPVHDALYLLLKRRHRDPYPVLRKMLEAMSMCDIETFIAAQDPLPDDVSAQFRSVTWEELEHIQRAGFTVGSHTRTHVLLPNESKVRILNETVGSRAELERRLGAPVRHFAYPSGAFDEASVQAVAEAGYRYAYATLRGGGSPLAIPRTILWEKSSVGTRSAFSGEVLHCQIHHAFDRFQEPAR